MAESNGLLDFVNSPAAMGLLAAGFGGLAGASRNTPVNNLGRAGLAGLTGYSAASALQGQRQKQEQLELRKKSVPGLFRTGADGSTTFDWQGATALGIDPKDIASYSALPNAGRTKVARTMEVPSLGGGKQTIQLDDYGQAVGEARDSYVAPQLVDTGDSKQFVTPNAGQSFAVGMSPSERDASGRGWANVGVRNEANNILREGVDVQRQAQRTQVVTMPDGSFRLVDKGTSEVTQPKTADGQPLPTAPAKLTEAEGKGSVYLSQMLDASKAAAKLPKVSPVSVGAAGSPWTNWMSPADAQQTAQTQRQWSEPYLRMKTGAAATQGEIDSNIKTFFPVVGDTPEVIDRKAQARAQAEQDMQIVAGRGAAQIKPVNAAAPQPYADHGLEAEFQAYKAANSGAPK